MSFFSEAYWWALAIGAAVLFGIYCRMGVLGAGSPFKNLIRTGFVSLVAVGFVFTGWRAGLGIGVGGALVGYLVPAILARLLVKPVVAERRSVGGPTHLSSAVSGRMTGSQHPDRYRRRLTLNLQDALGRIRELLRHLPISLLRR